MVVIAQTWPLVICDRINNWSILTSESVKTFFVSNFEKLMSNASFWYIIFEYLIQIKKWPFSKYLTSNDLVIKKFIIFIISIKIEIWNIYGILTTNDLETKFEFWPLLWFLTSADLRTIFLQSIGQGRHFDDRFEIWPQMIPNLKSEPTLTNVGRMRCHW